MHWLDCLALRQVLPWHAAVCSYVPKPCIEFSPIRQKFGSSFCLSIKTSQFMFLAQLGFDIGMTLPAWMLNLRQNFDNLMDVSVSKNHGFLRKEK